MALLIFMGPGWLCGRLSGWGWYDVAVWGGLAPSCLQTVPIALYALLSLVNFPVPLALNM